MRAPARLACALVGVALFGCNGATRDMTAEAPDGMAAAREAMVAGQIAARGILDERVLRAMRTVPRHEFVPPELRASAYEDHPLPIGQGQTISQPYIVAFMTDLAAVGPGSRVLEVGTGSGYQAAVLSELGAAVYSIELLAPLSEEAGRALARTGHGSVRLRVGDGHGGWPEAAPFDAIVVTAAAPSVPPALREQLASGGRLVIPVGAFDQEIEVHRRTADGFTVERVLPVRFVPLVKP
jgi:protein-L-isoaspartate(D-aspartate) O-methyltransferase